MAQFEADLADENADEDDATEEKASGKADGEEAWLKSDRDYSYDEVSGILCIEIRTCADSVCVLASRPCVQHFEAKQPRISR